MFDSIEYNKARSFIKQEVCATTPTKARLIQGHWNEATAYELPHEYAAVAYAVKNLVNHQFEVDGTQFILITASGLSHDELSDLLTYHYDDSIVFDERDGKNWDATMNEQLLTAECDVYDALHMKSAESYRKRCSSVKGKIFFKGQKPIKYLIAWKRLSGDWNTSIGNGIISKLICMNAICRLPPHLKPRKVVAFFLGDDYLGMYSYIKRPDLRDLTNALNDLERQMGITPVRGIFTDPLDVSFISLMVWPRKSGGYQFVPKPGKQLVKLFATTKTISKREMPNVLNGIISSMAYSFCGFRFMTQFLATMWTPGKYPTIPEYLAHKFSVLTRCDRKVDWEYGFYHHYGVLIQSLPLTQSLTVGLYHHPVVDEMLRVEGLDPCDRPACA